MYTILGLLVVAVLLVGGVITLRYGSRQKTGIDPGTDPNVQRHPVLLNRVFIIYIVFAAVVLFGVWILMTYHRIPF